MTPVQSPEMTDKLIEAHAENVISAMLNEFMFSRQDENIQLSFEKPLSKKVPVTRGNRSSNYKGGRKGRPQKRGNKGRRGKPQSQNRAVSSRHRVATSPAALSKIIK